MNISPLKDTNLFIDISINMTVFIKNGHFCIIDKLPYEIPEHLAHRGYAVATMLPNDKNEYDKYVALSKFLINMKFLGCQYTNEIREQCKFMDQKISSTPVMKSQ